MCDFELILFPCAHRTTRLIRYCHFARNDPEHKHRKFKKGSKGMMVQKRLLVKESCRDCPKCESVGVRGALERLVERIGPAVGGVMGEAKGKSGDVFLEAEEMNKENEGVDEDEDVDVNKGKGLERCLGGIEGEVEAGRRG
ncbi:hypothetical protein GQ43DRAFT_443707 [Delitschia confertaspora ATCC 74209]|uniref:Uncharacterized protein n=1 Tax=Delitschia confertaspora ATCC 74209 TaxID=1513339 RepID=A0A9P4JGW5_9PLEO|nr:hypothetical protein GQ43DRAFT_443707 [Delitschia confertaspora ATCC 74209]